MSPTAVDAAAAETARLGVHRAIDPPGTLVHLARALDAVSPANEYEAEIDVRMLGVDATSFGVIRRRCDADPQRMAGTIAQIVAEHGKLQNPWTGSGGVLIGTVRSVGERRRGPTPGQLVVPLASLIAIPLRLDSVGPVDPTNPQVPVRGRAIVTGAMLCAEVPDDMPQPVALAALDVYPVASHARRLAAPGGHVLILGAGHAGLLALAAARAAVGPEGTVSCVDVSPAALARAAAIDPTATVLAGDVTEPVAIAGALSGRGLAPAELTLSCTSVEGAEGAAMLATSRHGTVVFFSTATRFASAALGADAIGSQATLLIPSGLTDDRGQYAFELLRTVAPLRAAFEGSL